MKEEHYSTVIVGGGLAGLRTKSAMSSESHILLESGDLLGGRFHSGLHIMKEPEVRSAAFIEEKEKLKPIKIRWDKQWSGVDQVDWQDAAWKGVQLSIWDHYFSEDLLRVEFCFDKNEEDLSADPSFALSEPVVELSPCEGKSAWVLVTPQRTISADRVVWAAGIRAFQNAVGKIDSQKYMVANEPSSDFDKDYRGGFAIDWTIPKESFEETQLCTAIEEDSFVGVPVKHSGQYFLMFIHHSFQNNGSLCVRSLTYAHEDTVKDPKESLSLQKSLKRGLKMIFEDPNAVDLSKSHEKIVVDRRLMGASRGLPWLTKSIPESGIFFVGEESSIDSTQSMGLSRCRAKL